MDERIPEMISVVGKLDDNLKAPVVLALHLETGTTVEVFQIVETQLIN